MGDPFDRDARNCLKDQMKRKTLEVMPFQTLNNIHCRDPYNENGVDEEADILFEDRSTITIGEQIQAYQRPRRLVMRGPREELPQSTWRQKINALMPRMGYDRLIKIGAPGALHICRFHLNGANANHNLAQNSQGFQYVSTSPCSCRVKILCTCRYGVVRSHLP